MCNNLPEVKAHIDIFDDVVDDCVQLHRDYAAATCKEDRQSIRAIMLTIMQEITPIMEDMTCSH